MPDMKSVYSSMVDQIGYDEETKSFYVRWARTGKTSVYKDVDSRTASQVMRAASVGQAVNSLLKDGGFDHEYA